ncbi:MAG: DUF2089 domain-containing protein [Verrucomicrobia bacterium]|nr:DUF2089 domain-containing protein [Verrucomicrobiota bacterium]
MTTLDVHFDAGQAIPEKKVVTRCPFCEDSLFISRLSCGSCDTEINTKMAIPAYFRLPRELQDFVMVFLKSRGNIREVEKELGISYPTVCKRLDLVNELIGNRNPHINRNEILNQLERGDITAKEATRLLKEQT